MFFFLGSMKMCAVAQFISFCAMTCLKFDFISGIPSLCSPSKSASVCPLVLVVMDCFLIYCCILYEMDSQQHLLRIMMVIFFFVVVSY